MEINKRNRTDLKAYFVKNSIPTESNFAELIDGMLNQKEDGIAKLSGDPLSIEAAGDDASQQKLINFYRSFTDPNPLWTLNLNPRSDPNNPATARVGFSISDVDGNSRLFLDRSTGNAGIGTNKPDQKLTVYSGELNLQTDDNSKTQGMLFQNSGGLYTWRIYRSDAGNNLADLRFASGMEANFTALKDKLVLTKDGNIGVGVQAPQNSLDIQAVNRTGSHATGRPLYVTGTIGAADNGIEFRHTNGTQGIGFGFNTIYATGTNANQDLSLTARGQGKINIQGNLEVNGDIKVNGNDKQLWFPANDVREFIRFGSWERYAIGVQSGTQYFRTGKNFAWYKAGAHDDNELNPGGGIVQMVLKDGNLGIGTPDPGEKLTVNEGDVKIEGGRYRRLKIVSDKYWAGIELVAREQGEAGNPHIDFTHGDLDSPNYGIRLYASANDKFVITGGSVGIKVDPKNTLDIEAVNRTGSHETGRPLYVTGNIGAADNGIEFRHTNGTQGIGFGYNTIYATGTNANQDLSLQPKGSGAVAFRGGIRFETPSHGLATFSVESGIQHIGTTYSFAPHATYHGALGTPQKLWRNVYVHDLYRNYEYSASDIRIKENFRTIESPLEKILRLNGYLYDMKADYLPNDGKNGKDHMGLIAQEVKNVFPEIVIHQDETDKFYLSYQEIIPVIIEAIKEMKHDYEIQLEELRKKYTN